MLERILVLAVIILMSLCEAIDVGMNYIYERVRTTNDVPK